MSFYTAQLLLLIIAPASILLTKKMLGTTRPFQTKLQLNKKTTTPILLVILIVLLIRIKTNIEIQNNYSLTQTIISCFIAPITEETFYRGFAIGTLFALLKKIKKKNKLKINNQQEKTIKMIIIALSTSLFVLAHSPQPTYALLIRTAISLIYTATYLTNNKNLLPPILTHATYNTTLTIITKI